MGELTLEEHYRQKRKDWLYYICERVCDTFLSSYFSIVYENAEALKALENKGFILLPKHQRNLDVPLEGTLIYETLGRPANFIMKSSLPRIFEFLGGIGLTRFKDISGIIDREERRKALKEAERQKEYVNRVILHLLSNEEIVVIHPEGQRNYKRPAPPKIPILANLIKIQERLGRYITFVPLDIDYQSRFIPRSRITVRVGSPVHVDDAVSLENHLVRDIKLMVKN